MPPHPLFPSASRHVRRPRAPRAPALVDARGLWVPDARGVWRLRGASVAVWSGEAVCVVGADAGALRALLGCLRGSPPWGGVVQARPGWWRTGRTVGPLDARGRPAARLAPTLQAAAERATGGAVVLALVIADRADAWSALHEATALASRRAPLRCVALVGGRVVPPFR